MFYKFRERFGLIFYANKQSYKFNYEVFLRNNSKEVKDFTLIIPIPSEFNNQKLLSEPQITPTGFTVQADDSFKNKYISWKIHLESHEMATFSEQFTLEVSPVSTSLTKHYSFKDYAKVDSSIMEKYCMANAYISPNNKEIIEFAKKIKGDDDDVMAVARRLNDFVISYLDYKNVILGLYTALEALEKKTVDCGGFNVFFLSLANAIGIPGRVVSGFLLGYPTADMHLWGEFMLPDGQWIPVDSSMEQLYNNGKSLNVGRFGHVGSDRVIFSKGCDIPLLLNGQKVFTDILQNPFFYPPQSLAEVEMRISCHSKRL